MNWQALQEFGLGSSQLPQLREGDIVYVSPMVNEYGTRFGWRLDGFAVTGASRHYVTRHPETCLCDGCRGISDVWNQLCWVGNHRRDLMEQEAPDAR